MVKHIRAAVTAFVLLTIITGILYPLAMTGLAQVMFPVQANGSLVERNGQVIGSSLIGQTTDDPAYFRGRPSAVNTMQGGELTASGATNYGWTSAALAEQAAERAASIRAANNLADDAPIPVDLLFASASGFDPHISPEAAALQIDRVAAERDVDRAAIESLVAQYTENPQFELFGEPRVNVLLLNIALDDLQ